MPWVALSVTHHSFFVNMSDNGSDDATPLLDGCVHPFQCPNRSCQRVFTTRRGLSMHFYHQKNVFCNPPNQFRTLGEIAVPSVLPLHMDAEEDSMDDDSDPNLFDDFLAPVWSGSEHSSTSSSSSSDGPPNDVLVNPNSNPMVPPNVDSMNKTFGISYTTTHAIETKRKDVERYTSSQNNVCLHIEMGSPCVHRGLQFCSTSWQ